MVEPAGNPAPNLLTTWLAIELIAVSLTFPFSSRVTDRTLESYAQRLTINIIDALNSTSTSSALSAKQGSILKGLVDSKANSRACI
jgi:hypothetical protein